MTAIDPKRLVSIDGYIRRGLLGVATISLGELDQQYCFYANLLLAMERHHREQYIEAYWLSGDGKLTDWVPTLRQIRTQNSGIFLEILPESSRDSAEKVLEEVE